MGRIRLDLLAKLVDEDAEVFHLTAIIRPPHRLQKLDMGDDLIGITGEVAKKIKLFGSQAYFRAVDGNPASDKVDYGLAQVQHIGCARTCERRPAEGGANAG